METCAGCGAQLQPAWKFCVFCGRPVDSVDPAASTDSAHPADSAPVIPGAIRGDDLLPEVPRATVLRDAALKGGEHRGEPAPPKSGRTGNIALLVGGVAAFLIGAALIVIAIAYAVGALK